MALILLDIGLPDRTGFELLDRLNQSYEIYIVSLELSENFGVDVSSQRQLLKEDLVERAANGSAFLELNA